MKRIVGAGLLLVAGVSGCLSGPETGGGSPINYGKSYGPPAVPGVVGPNGSKVPMVGPYDMAPPANAYQAQRMMQNSQPLSAVQMNPVGGPSNFGPAGAGVPPTMVPRGGTLSPPGLPFAPGVSPGANVPSGPFLPGGPGLSANGMNMPPGAMPRGGVMPAQFAQAKGGAGVPFTIGRTQVKFTRPTGMKITWFTMGPDGKPTWSTTPIETPGRYNFGQAAIYRLRLSNIEGRPGLELYPTLEVVPTNPNTEAFLAHSSVPVEFTNEDFKQVAEGNYIVKVIYLPYPQFQDAAGTGIDEILSTRLEPGADPIEEARRRGSILLVIRMGNVDQEAPNTPPLNAPPPGFQPQPQPGPMPPGMGRPNLQLPIYGTPAPRMPPPGPMPPMNPKDAGKATTGGFPGAPLNVPSVPLPGPGVPSLGEAIAPAPSPAADTKTDTKAKVPAGPALPTIPALKDGGKATPEFTPVAPPSGAKDTAVPLPSPPPPSLPTAPPLPDLNPGPQSRSTEAPATPVELAELLATPRR